MRLGQQQRPRPVGEQPVEPVEVEHRGLGVRVDRQVPPLPSGDLGDVELRVVGRERQHHRTRVAQHVERHPDPRGDVDRASTCAGSSRWPKCRAAKPAYASLNRHRVEDGIAGHPRVHGVQQGLADRRGQGVVHLRHPCRQHVGIDGAPLEDDRAPGLVVGQVLDHASEPNLIHNTPRGYMFRPWTLGAPRSPPPSTASPAVPSARCWAWSSPPGGAGATPPASLLAVVLAFFFGYLLTFVGVRRAGLDIGTAVRTALAADTLSILVMEIVDNAFLLAVPGAMEAGLGERAVLGRPGGRAGRGVRADRAGQQVDDRPRARGTPSSTRCTVTTPTRDQPGPVPQRAPHSRTHDPTSGGPCHDAEAWVSNSVRALARCAGSGSSRSPGSAPARTPARSSPTSGRT